MQSGGTPPGGRSGSRGHSRSRSSSASRREGDGEGGERHQREAEFQAVILAGAGSSLGTLTQQYPKALLPLLNRPMLTYQLALLGKANFSDVIVAVDGFGEDKAQLKRMQEFIAEHNAKSKLRVGGWVRRVWKGIAAKVAVRGGTHGQAVDNR